MTTTPNPTPFELVHSTPVPGWAAETEAVRLEREDYEVWQLRRDGRCVGYMYDDGNGYEFAEGEHNVPFENKE